MEDINPSVSDILGALSLWAPPELAEDWDNPGLTVGNPEVRVKTIVVALDASLKGIEEASHRSAELLVTHHPLPLKPVRALIITEPTQGRIAMLLKKGISLVSMHTNLDAAQGGVNDCLGEILGLRDMVPLDNKDAPTGLGRLGRLQRPCTLGEFMALVKRRLGAPALSFAGDLSRHISMVAICGGSCGDMWRLAWKMGADCLLTGEIRYHQALDAVDAGLTIVAAGHFETERPIVKKIAEFLKSQAEERGWEVKVHRYLEECSPLKIF